MALDDGIGEVEESLTGLLGLFTEHVEGCCSSIEWVAMRMKSLEIWMEEYERVRGNSARFVVAAGHQLPGVERIVEGTSRFLVVEKIGAAGEVARASDPRQHG